MLIINISYMYMYLILNYNNYIKKIIYKSSDLYENIIYVFIYKVIMLIKLFNYK